MQEEKGSIEDFNPRSIARYFHPEGHDRIISIPGPSGSTHSGTRVRGNPCRATRVALHVSQQISSEFGGFSGVAAVSRYTPLKGPVAPVALELPGCGATLCN